MTSEIKPTQSPGLYCQAIYRGNVRQLTPQEQNHVKMHKCLVAIQSSAGWENIDPYTQDEIDSAVREGKQWFGK